MEQQFSLKGSFGARRGKVKYLTVFILKVVYDLRYLVILLQLLKFLLEKEGIIYGSCSWRQKAGIVLIINRIVCMSYLNYIISSAIGYMTLYLLPLNAEINVLFFSLCQNSVQFLFLVNNFHYFFMLIQETNLFLL